MQMVVFLLEGECFGIPVKQVREINRLTRITTVPNVPKHVLGVIDLRGDVIPVISLREYFGYQEKAGDGASRIIVAEVGELKVGLVVDAVLEVVRVQEESLEPVPENVMSRADFFKGISKQGDRLIVVLDTGCIVNASSVYGENAVEADASPMKKDCGAA